METFPAFFPLKGKQIVIAGAGEPADAKARLFAGSPAQIVRIDGPAALDPASYGAADLIFIASFDADFRQGASAAARSAGAPLNVVDAPELSDFHTPAIIDRGQVVAAIGTAGASPLLASLLRTRIEAQIPESAGPLAAMLGAHRETILEEFPDLAHRRAFLRSILSGPVALTVAEGDMPRATALLEYAIGQGFKGVGKVSFIEGARRVERISLGAARALNLADVILVGEGSEMLLRHHARRDAEHLQNADAEVLIALVNEGRLVAVVAEAFDGDLFGKLMQAGLAVHRYRPAPP